MKKTVKFLIMMIVIIALAVSMTACLSSGSSNSKSQATREELEKEEYYLPPYGYPIDIDEMGPIYGYTDWGVIRHPDYCEHSKRGTPGEHTFATCTEPETQTYECYWCGTPIYTEILEEAHHTDISIYEAVEPSCSPGYTYGEYCYGCDTWIVEREEIPPIYEEHDWLGRDCSGIDSRGEACAYCESGRDHPMGGGTSSATCTMDGYGYDYCWRCSQEIISTIYPATGHNYVDGVCVNNPWPWSDKDYTCGAIEPGTCKHDQGTRIIPGDDDHVICNRCNEVLPVDE